MHKISDQELIKQVFSNADAFATLDTVNTLFLLEILNKKFLELTINTLVKTGNGIEVDFHHAHPYFSDIFDSLNIQPNSIRVKIEASYLYMNNSAFLWQTSENNFVSQRNLDNIKALVTCGILAFDPLQQIDKKESYLVSEFIKQPVLFCLPKKIKLPLNFADKHFKVGTRESKKYILLLKKLWSNPTFLKNTDPLSTICVLLDLMLQRLYSLSTLNPETYLSNIIHYLRSNVLGNPITLSHPNNLIIGYIFKLDHLKKDERNDFLLELSYSKNTLAQVKNCLENMGVTLINETLP